MEGNEKCRAWGVRSSRIPGTSGVGRRRVRSPRKGGKNSVPEWGLVVKLDTSISAGASPGHHPVGLSDTAVWLVGCEGLLKDSR